ncbi:putative nadh flavin oxidoreductase nadh oxidase [Lyophyllum shimeji]|uniref:Nadh flavin oxidoreductase nadh oxidase n=1 Tax=Lyophyllum shimeji TaxID=47721 RepID=A0A9P3PQK7_LYOSH|nr:putative nadh flavin oxidoreductase nadh oxidase [Lyophyllum shimeji]
MKVSKLFEPVQVGDMILQHRVVLAPLTRFRADDQHVSLLHVAEYYAQRASLPGTLLISEATFIAQRAGGYPNAPGIWSDAQIAAWKRITDAVHAKGSFMYLQLWALGRAANPKQLASEGVNLPYVSASALPLLEQNSATPRALTIAEIEEYVELYAAAAHNAVHRAGFDGVEVHGANGYLIDQFLQDVSNVRKDVYGGSVQNRARFALEVVDAVVKRVGARKTAIRFSPWSTNQGMGMRDPKPTFSYVVRELRMRYPDLAYIHVIEPRVNGTTTLKSVPTGQSNDFIREIWCGGDSERRLISAGGYTRATGMAQADATGELIAYGRPFIANPDLPYRLAKNVPLAVGARKWYYRYGSTDPKGKWWLAMFIFFSKSYIDNWHFGKANVQVAECACRAYGHTQLIALTEASLLNTSALDTAPTTNWVQAVPLAKEGCSTRHASIPCTRYLSRYGIGQNDPS